MTLPDATRPGATLPGATLKLQVYSDYVCPYCFLAEGPLNEAVAAQNGAVEVEWMPFELRPHPTPTLRPEDDYLQTAWRDSVYPLAARMAVPIVLPKVSPQPYSRLAFEGALIARGAGAAQAYNHRMFTAFFQEERDIGDADVLTACAREIGLDAAAFRAALDAGKYRVECAEQLRHAVQTMGIRSVPTFAIGGLAVPGLLPADTLKSLLRDALASTAS